MVALNNLMTPSLEFEEILSDGSTLSNADADSRRLFFGEDGLFHMKDSAGAVTDVGGGGITQAYVGKNAVGASYEAATAARVVAKKVTLANDALVTDIEVYIKQVADVAATQVFAFLFDDNGSGTAPKHLLMSMGSSRDMVLEESSSGPRDARWMGVPCGRWCVAADYWIAWQLFDPDFNIAYDTGGSDPYMSPSNPQIGDWGLWSPTNSTRDYSIRANTIR